MTRKRTQKRRASSYPAHLLARVKQVCRRIGELDLDAILITSHFDVRYLTGFVGEDSWALLRRRSSLVHLLSDFRFKEQIEREAPQARAVMREGSLSQELAKLADRYKLAEIGIQADHVTLQQRKAIRRELDGGRLAAVDDRLLTQRAIKDEKEVAAIRRAVKVTQDAYRRTLRHLKPGQTENEIAAYLEYQMRLLGADGAAFPSIVAAGANGSLPHAIPGNAKVRQGGTVLFDWGAVVGGYCGDLTRVVALGRMPRKIREIYRIVLDAHDAAIDAVRPGKKLTAVDAVARQWIDKAGYAAQFGHALGHGIGLQIHEQPVLSSRSKGVLEPGHVVTVEPGIYLPGIGGVRIESDVLVTQRGARVLSHLPTDLESAII